MSLTALLLMVVYFFLYSLLGWCAEVAFAAVESGQLVNRGFLNGPICPIYGFGMVAMLVLLDGWTDSVPAVFVGGMIITTLIELIGGWLLYVVFHTRWWDYSKMRFNLGGYICPRFSLLWGAGSVVLVMVVHPLLSAPLTHLPFLPLAILDGVLCAIFLADVICSVIAAAGLSKHLTRIDELRAAIRLSSDRLTEVIGSNAITIDALLDEQKLQLTLAAMEGRENAAELRDQLLTLAARAKTVRDETAALARHRFFGAGHLLRAFPTMRSPLHAESLAHLRQALSRLSELRPRKHE